jgi:DNA-binding HxlR family transcriptional regulator
MSRPSPAPRAARGLAADTQRPARRRVAAADAAAGADPSAGRRGEVLSALCPSREVLQHVTSRWGVLVLVVLRGGTHRFSELRRKIGGVSEKMLAQTLQTLESDGFLRRTAHPVVPPHVDYDLTLLGREMARQVAEMVDWIEGNLPRILAGREPAAG